MVECDLAKVEVAGSNPVSRSNIFLFAGSRGRVNGLRLAADLENRVGFFISITSAFANR